MCIFYILWLKCSGVTLWFKDNNASNLHSIVLPCVVKGCVESMCKWFQSFMVWTPRWPWPTFTLRMHKLNVCFVCGGLCQPLNLSSSRVGHSSGAGARHIFHRILATWRRGRKMRKDRLTFTVIHQNVDKNEWISICWQQEKMAYQEALFLFLTSSMFCSQGSGLGPSFSCLVPLHQPSSYSPFCSYCPQMSCIHRVSCCSCLLIRGPSAICR